MLSEKLKEFTKESHLKLEKILIGKMKAISSADDYVELLQLFYSYFGAIENRINTLPVLEVIPDYEKRRKTESLLNDMAVFSNQTVKLANEEDIPAISNKLQALGALYVMEGSTLGGPMISKMISGRLQRENSDGFSFFRSYGDNTQAMWEEFKKILNEQHIGEDETEQLLIAAEETFKGFINWIQKNN